MRQPDKKRTIKQNKATIQFWLPLDIVDLLYYIEPKFNCSLSDWGIMCVCVCGWNEQKENRIIVVVIIIIKAGITTHTHTSSRR